ncbi:MAG TPA: TonB-dependent receptor [Porphyromonadaceae bacterium]|nr:TonB-dependent receptor [Porphyromonadaceae bacterium]
MKAKPLITYIIPLILCLLAPAAAIAQVQIHGKVSDMENSPMEFVTVRVAGTAIGTTTGIDGSYKLSAPANDTITVVFSCIGYDELRRQLINPEGDMALSVQMRSKDHTLHEIEVTDFRKQTNQMQTIDQSSYSLAADASGGSVESMLSTLAGVNSNNEMSSQYSVRGGTYDENSVYINGIEVYRPQLITSGQQEGLSVINPNMVGAIGFSTGGFGVEYGDKMSSALDITYKEPEAFEASLSASLMGASASLGTSSRRFSQLHGVRYKRAASLLSSMETKGEYDPNFFDYQTNLTYKFSKKLKASFLGNIAINNYKFTPVNRTTNFGTSTDAKQFKVFFDGGEKDRFETYFGALNLTYEHSRSTAFSLLASGYLTNELVAYDISGEYWLDQAGTTGGGDSDNAIGGELGVGRYHEHARNRLKISMLSIGLQGHTSIRRHNLTYGLGVHAQKIMERSREWELRDSAGYTLPSDGTNIRMIYNLTSRHDLSTTRMAAYLADSYRFNTSAGYFAINAGLRLSYWDFNKEFLISPRANVAFVPERNNNLTFRFATGLYYQQPFYKEFRRPDEDAEGNTVITLNDRIKSQQSIHFILGGDYTFRAFGRPFKLSAEAYYKKLNKLIPYEVDNLKVTYAGENQTHGYTTGLDLKLFGQFVPGTDSWVSFSVMKTGEVLNGITVPRPTDQRYSLAVYFTDYFPKFPKLKFSLRGILSDGLPVTAPHSSRDKGYFRTPAYKRVDVGLHYALLSPPDETSSLTGIRKWCKSIWLGLDVFNLLDISNVSSYYWVTDVNSIQYAVPNYLTRRQFNVTLSIDF